MNGFLRVLTFLVAFVVAGPLFGAELYWPERGADRICRSLPDGSSWSVFISGVDTVGKLAVDDVGRYVYVPETLLENIGGVTSVALDLVGGKLYWISAWGSLGRANLDGSDPETLVTGLGAPQDIALDITGGKMYWGDLLASTLRRANLDGSGIEDLVTGVDAGGVELDLVSAKIYWADQNADYIGWANLDGSNPQDLIIGLLNPNGMAIDHDLGKLYWAESTDLVKRANLDGSDPETLVTGLDFVRGVAFDFRDAVFSDDFESGGTTYWSGTTP
jgi:hypothetical protein